MKYIGRNKDGELAFNADAAKGYFAAVLQDVLTTQELWWLRANISQVIDSAMLDRALELEQENKENNNNDNKESGDGD